MLYHNEDAIKGLRIETTAQTLAGLVQAVHNCEKTGTHSDWLTIHTDTIKCIVAEHMPTGSGFDSGTKIDVAKSNADKLVFHTSFHHMNDAGFYDGWTEHNVTVTPCFQGVNVKVSGVNKNDIKDYIYECFHHSLGSPCRVISPAEARAVNHNPGIKRDTVP